MHIHILGICGTFMGGIALIARELGFKVTGSDRNVYPPMSDELRREGIEITEGYGEEQLHNPPDLIVVGNAMKRGMPVIEYMLNKGLPYTSGPGFIEDYVVPGRDVIGIAGTHGKTTTSSMVAWILEKAGKKPGFLIGGVPENFGISARKGDGKLFVIESDEYDTAFFDKRSKFVHYHPVIQILNNLEYDHADIFPNLEAIKVQFHHLVRTIPGRGSVVVPDPDEALEDVISRGLWSNLVKVGFDHGEWTYRLIAEDGSEFEAFRNGESLGTVKWPLIGLHNVKNALMAIAACAADPANVDPKSAVEALSSFEPPLRRMEYKGEFAGVKLYDDFAHHPTAIRTTIHGLREKIGKDARLIAVLEPRSNTMKLGVHRKTLAGSLEESDIAFVFAPQDLPWNTDELAEGAPVPLHVFHDFDQMLEAVVKEAKSGDTILTMSNGGFSGITKKLPEALSRKA